MRASGIGKAKVLMNSKRSVSGKPEGIKIFAYGFNAAGFEIPREPLSLKSGHMIEFVGFKDSTRLDSADGIIIPQGIFERIEYKQSYDGIYGTVSYEQNLLLEREKQVVNLFGDRKWICFLVDKIEDKVDSGWGRSRDIQSTDLCKRILNAYGVYRQAIEGGSAQAKNDEFSSYIRKYGVAKTILDVSRARDRDEMRILATLGDYHVGVEFLGQFFFLPFHTTRKDSATTTEILKEVAQAVIAYRQKRITEIPAWLDEEFQFGKEGDLRSELASLHERENKLQGELQSWRNYKAILTTSGDILKGEVVRILKNFFHLTVDLMDENIEDAKILNDDKKDVLAMVEVKGTKQGIKRDNINQVDSHRERNELVSSIPGVLFINNEMSVNGLSERLKTTVPDEQIRHAQNLNVLIVRTVDLLFLMKHLENDPERKNKLINLLTAGGGWLQADSGGYKLVQLPK